MSVSLTKNTPTQRAFFRTIPESPLLSQKQAKLVLSAKACDYKPHKKRSYIKGLFFPAPYQNRRFYHKNKRSLFYLPNPVFIHNSSFSYPKPVIVSLTKKAPTQRAFFRTLPESPLLSQKHSEACFICQSL